MRGPQFTPIGIIIVLFAIAIALTIWVHGDFGWLAAVIGILVIIGIVDAVQTRHSVRRNYPLFGRLRWVGEQFRPEIQQYFVEQDTEGRPFDRSHRSQVYQRAKDTHGEQPFGTQLDVYASGYEWFSHSLAPKAQYDGQFRVRLDGDGVGKPYDMSLLNVSAMSFGSLSSNAIVALNEGARRGEFAHDTGEGGLSEYHQQGGDLVWEIGTGYFGARSPDGKFDPDRFTEVSNLDQVKCVSVKLSQGAKPGLGGVMPAAKVTAEIAGIRGVPEGVKCVSPPHHTAFSTPEELLTFVDELRRMSGGKPTGFKLCIGRPTEFLGICNSGRFLDHRPDGGPEYQQFWREVKAADYEVLGGPNKLMRWGAADPSVHDDLLTSAALCAVLARQDRRPPLASHIIEADDPLASPR